MLNNRLKKSIINSSVASITQIATILIRFLVQTIFIHKLGIIYVGINGLFSNVLLILSFAELGIGSALVYAMYKPLSLGDRKNVIALMRLFKKAYLVIAIIVLIAGLSILPFLKLFIKNGNMISGIYIYYLLYLLNSVVSYLFTYKRSILTADQMEYVNNINQFLFLFIQSLLQLFILIILENYFMFLVVQLLCTALSNVFISLKVDKLYPYLKVKNKYKISHENMRNIINNVLGLMGSQFGGIIVFGTDNILISSFLGIISVGLYSNYSLIIQSITNIINKAVNSVIPSIGNLGVTSNRKSSYEAFKKYNFMNFMVVYFSSSYLISCLNPFIELWIGNRYLLPKYILFCIIINFIINQLRQSSLSYIGAFGLYRKVGWKSILEAIMNLASSLIFIIIFNMGLLGILLGNIFSNLIINFWWEPYVVYKYVFEKKVFVFYKRYLLYLLFIIMENTIILRLTTIINTDYLYSLLLNILITTVISLALFVICFNKSKEFIFFRKTFFNIVKHRI